MEINQAKERKRQLEKEISELLNKFSAETGLTVYNITILTVSDYGGKNTYSASVEALL